MKPTSSIESLIANRPGMKGPSHVCHTSPPTNYLSVRGVSLHPFTREGSPTIVYCPICPFIGVEWEMVFQQMANQSSANAPCLRSASSFDTTRA